MAEKAAHISFTSEAKPSIFEVIAQNSLNVTLQPAFQKISEFIAECSPTYFGWLFKYQHESFLVVNGLLQYYYLKTYDASFSEYFYGLRRVSLKNIPLSKEDKRWCLLFIILLPYIQSKLLEKLSVYKLEDAEGLLADNLQSYCKKILLYSHSAIGISWNVWILLNYLRYMSDQAKSQHPILYLLKLKLIYTEEVDDMSLFWSALFNGKLNLKDFGTGLLQNGIRTTLEIGAFFVQFLQTWYKEKSSYSITSLPMVPPPHPDPNGNTYKGKCPICLQPWKIPTVVPVSGYVFCFSCIVKHLREDSRCPVTNYPTKPMDIIRLYDG